MKGACGRRGRRGARGHRGQCGPRHDRRASGGHGPRVTSTARTRKPPSNRCRRARTAELLTLGQVPCRQREARKVLRPATGPLPLDGPGCDRRLLWSLRGRDGGRRSSGRRRPSAEHRSDAGGHGTPRQPRDRSRTTFSPAISARSILRRATSRLRARLANEQTEHDRGVKPDGHSPIPWQCSDGCRSIDATFPWRIPEGSPPRTSRAPDPSEPTPSAFRRAGAPPRPSPPERGPAPCRERPGGCLALGGDGDYVHVPKAYRESPYPAMYRVRHYIYPFLTEG